MTVQLSPHKVKRIIRGYFRGLTQTRIAREAGVDQATVSHYATRFKKIAAETSPLTAAKEFGVFIEVDGLRSLSVEMNNSQLSVEEAREGHNIIKAFLKLGISPAQYLSLVEVCRQVEDPGFVEAALKLSQIEAQTRMEYHRVMSDFEKALNQLPRLEGKVTETKAKLKSLNDTLVGNKQELADQEKYLKKYRDEVEAKVAQLNKELLAKMKQSEIVKKEVEEVAGLKADLAERGMTLQSLLKLGKEFRHERKRN